MAEQKALLLETPKGEFRVGQMSIPKPGPGELLVKILATALNPGDWRRHEFNLFVPTFPAIFGTDAARTVEALGEGYEGNFLYYDKATFQQYGTVLAELAAKLPENISFDEATSIPLGIATTAVGLYDDRPAGVQKYTPCWEEGGEGLYRGKPIVVFGGSSSVGQYGKELHHNQILGDTPVELVYDAISEKDKHGTFLLFGGTLVLDLVAVNGARVEKDKGKTVIDTDFAVLHTPELRQLGVSLQSKLTRLLETGKIKPNRVELLPGGLVPDGLKRMKENKAGGVKLIARPFETA